jgi:hypothetical protein
MAKSSLSRIRYQVCLKGIRTWLGLSLSEMGTLLETKASSIADWQSGHRIMPGSKIQVIGQRIADKLTSEYGRTIGVKMSVNGAWRVTAFVQCSQCRAWFELKHPHWRRCEECRVKHD